MKCPVFNNSTEVTAMLCIAACDNRPSELETLVRHTNRYIVQHNLDAKLRVINVSEIEYIQCCDHVQKIYRKDGILVEQRRSTGKLQEELDALVPGQLVVSHKGLFVNLSAVGSIDQSRILLRSGMRATISRGTTKQLQTVYVPFHFKKEGGR